ncbi:glycine cleavage system aminomethyltransferase GcvT [Aquisalimonas asiatica]|uniref:Aminomethyltransferase n=1 Tax=Aquisalimonas asiatica TaxID=406100 RepID=A0A1H8VJW1_9GAMM|nr:glycine cleavage system aminomethyltransferase GcvT [Aquisalimonas asiatica]SEP15517.1 aminomethyltransferase [Aquisalimonas asiatica]
MLQRTPLYERHKSAGAKLVDFAGWEMPVNYGSQIKEHEQVRSAAGLFDVSHMGVVDVSGADALAFLRRLLANDAARLKEPGQAFYTCMLNDAGGIIDDLIVYYLSEGRYRIVVNAARRTEDLDWMTGHAEQFDVRIRERADAAMIAVQGPQAEQCLGHAVDARLEHRLATLKPFRAMETGDWLIARTGYTGEDGFEVVLPARSAVDLWDHLTAAGAAPCGLGARDSLRLEAGLHLYGQDMDTTTTPLESALGWTVAWTPEDRDFIGRGALEKQREAGVSRRLVGFVLEGRGVLRHGQTLNSEAGGAGEITSGGFSPVLGCSIAMARIPAGDEGPWTVDMRGRALPVRRVKPPFVRNGQAFIN